MNLTADSITKYYYSEKGSVTMQSLMLKPTQISWYSLPLTSWGSWEKSGGSDTDSNSCDKEPKYDISEIQIKLD